MTADIHPYPAEMLKTVFTRGSDYDIGVQHAEQVGDALRKGMTQFYFDFWQRMSQGERYSPFDSLMVQSAKFLLDKFIIRRLKRAIPPSARQRVMGLCRAVSMSYDEMTLALILPDLFPMLQAYFSRLRPSTFIDVAPPPTFGCSSFVSSGRYFLHGRNLDFPGVAYWDRYPVVQLTEKTDSLRYIAFTTAGVPFGGITGINEAQMSVALHQHYGLRTSLKGKLPFLIAESLLCEARTLDDALKILKETPVATSWAFIVTDGKTRRAFIYECHSRGSGVRFLSNEDPVLTHSNFFQTAECQLAEYATTERMNWDNHCREQRLRELLKLAGADLTPEEAVKFLSDHVDPYWNEEKYVNRTVSQVYNIQSLVLDSDRMLAFLALGNCPVQIRRYHEIDLGRVFARQAGETGQSFPGYTFQSPDKRQAKESYILSFVAAFDADYATALERLGTTLESDFSAEAGLVGAVLSLKMHEYDKAVQLLSRAKEWVEQKKERVGRPVLPPEYFEVCLFLARAYDLLGRRSEALTLYRMVAAHGDLVDSNVRNLAKGEGPYRDKHLSRILMPYSTYIPFL